MTQNKRVTILVSVLLMLVGFVLGKPFFEDYQNKPRQVILEGKNKIKDIRLKINNGNIVTVEVDYFYNGKLEPNPALRLVLNDSIPDDRTERLPHLTLKRTRPMKVGSQTHKFSINRPFLKPYRKSFLITDVSVSMSRPTTEKIGYGAPYEDIVKFNKQLNIAWHPAIPGLKEYISESNIDESLKKAVSFIDNGYKDDLGKAKQILDGIVLFDEKYIHAYPELARYYIRVDRNKEGFSKAERMLDIALKIDSEHANSLILLGLVYMHQKRFDESENIYDKVSKLETDNLWYFVNMGFLAHDKGEEDRAVKHYMQAIDAKRPHNHYDRAKRAAYQELIRINLERKEFSNIDDLYTRQRIEFPEEIYLTVEHGELKLILGELDQANDLVEEGLKDCQRQDYSKKIMSFVYLMQWANLKKNEDSSLEMRLLSRSQVLYSNMPELFHYLAYHEKISSAIPKLISEGFDINSSNSRGNTALLIAIRKKNINATMKLLENGADANQLNSEQQMSPLMMAVISKNMGMVKVLLGAGVDASLTNDYGLDAESLAKELGLKAIASLIGSSVGV